MLIELQQQLADLDDELATLDEAINREIAAEEDEAPWSAALAEIAERVAPISPKDEPPPSPALRRMAAQRRRSVRLVREAAYLRERTRALSAELARLRQQSLATAHGGAALRTWSRHAQVYQARVGRWCEELDVYERWLEQERGGRH